MIMAEARLRCEWDRAAVIAAEVHNAGFGCEKARPPADFHPYERQRKARDEDLPEVPFSTLKQLFAGVMPPPAMPRAQC